MPTRSFPDELQSIANEVQAGKPFAKSKSEAQLNARAEDPLCIDLAIADTDQIEQETQVYRYLIYRILST